LERGTSKTSWNATFQNAGFARRAALRCRAACDPGKNFLSGASRGLFGNRNRGTRLELRARWANSNPNRNSKTNADSNPNSNSKTNADSNPNSNSKTNADSNPNSNSKTNADSNPNSNSKTNADSNPNPHSNIDADSYIDTNVDSNPNSAADADSISNANPNSTSGNGASRGVCHRQLRGGRPRRGA
jgi:translation initiation factor IF-2